MQEVTGSLDNSEAHSLEWKNKQTKKKQGLFLSLHSSNTLLHVRQME